MQFDRLTKASDRDAVNVEFLDNDGVIPLGMVTLVGGRPGHGKSLWTAALVAQVSRKNAVIMSNLEDAVEQTTIPRLIAAGANMKNVHLASLDDPMKLPDHLSELEAMIEYFSAPLTILDPLSQHLTVSIYNGQDVRKAMGPLNALVQRQNCSIVAVHHTVKYTRSVDHALQAFGGDMGGLPGAVRVAYVFGKHPNDAEKRCLAWAKINFAAEPPTQEYLFDMKPVYNKAGELIGNEDGTPYLVPAPEVLDPDGNIIPCLVTALEMVQHRDGKSKGDNSTHDAPRLAEAEAFITNYLCMGPRPQTELQEDAVRLGITVTTLKRAKKEIGVITAREGFGGGTCGDCQAPWTGGKNRTVCKTKGCGGTNRVPSRIVWSLPADHPALIEEDDDE